MGMACRTSGFRTRLEPGSDLELGQGALGSGVPRRHPGLPLMTRPFCFDAVIFDLDGTLVATDRFWVDAARIGARRAFDELGLDRRLPSSEEWMSLVGLPLEEGFRTLFADLEPTQVDRVRTLCVEEEELALKAGRARLLPFAAEALDELSGRGVRLGIASNCGRDYLSAMMDGLGLARWVDEARCLDSAGVHTKTDMVEDLLLTFGTRAAVMVGDRLGDRDAAYANGMPHVHCARGFATSAEVIECEAVIEDLSELVPRLYARATWIEGLVEELGVLQPAGPRTLGVTGRSGAGKTLFARDLARVLTARGVEARVVSLDDFPGPAQSGAGPLPPADRPLDHLEAAFDVRALVEHVLEPYARGEAVELELPRDGRLLSVPAGAVLVVEGLFLLHPRIRSRLDRVVHLAVDEGLSLRRIAGRDAPLEGPEALVRVRRDFLPVQRAFEAALQPSELADLVLDAGNALGPWPPAEGPQGASQGGKRPERRAGSRKTGS